MEASALLAEVPAAVRDLVIGHWPETDVECMRARGDCYIRTGNGLNTAADGYESRAKEAEESVSGATRTDLAQRNRTVVAAMRSQATVCADMGGQCHEVADVTEQTQHLLVVTGIVLGVQLAYDAMLFFYGGGFKAMADRLAAEQAMRLAVGRLTTHVATQAAAGAARRAALHTAVHAAAIGGLTGAAISVGAQLWDIQSGARDGFDLGSFGEMVAGGVVGGVVGAEAGRRIAPRVLGMFGRRATSDIGRFGAHLGGTVLIGGVGGVAGGVAGAIPSLIIHHKDIHSLGDMFDMVRESAVVGFGGGFVGAAGNALRVHRAGVAGARGGLDLPPIARRQLEFGRRVEGLLAGEPPRTEPMARHSTQGNSARTVELLTFPDGSQVVHKVVSDPRHAQAEFLTSLMGDAVGARVPAVHLDGRHVYMEVVPGKNAQEAYPKDWSAETRFHGTPSGTRLGVLDALVGVPDRGAENWMITPDAEVWAIGNSLAFTPEVHIGAFAKQFLEYGSADGTHQWKEHTVTRAELGEIRQRVEELSPAFSALGRSDWHDSALTRLDQMAHHAPPGPSRGPDIVVPQSHIAGEAQPARPPATATRPGVEGRTGDTGSAARPTQDGPPGSPQRRVTAHNGETERPPALPGQQESAGQPKTVDAGAAPKDLPPDAGPLSREEADGPPTRPLPRIDPPDDPRHDPAPAPPAAGQTGFFRHPESGHVDVVFTPPGGAEIPLRLTPGNEYVLGSNKGALLHGVANDYVSRQHATIRVDEAGHVFLRDDNSMNGTFIDGKQMVGGEWVRVYDGQQLMLSRGFELGLDFRRQVAEVRLFGNDAPPLRVHRDSSVGFGRDLLNANSVNRLTMSRDHARIGMDEHGRVWLQDDGSTNGTWVNEVRLADGEQRILRPGDTVRFGLAGGDAQFLPADAVRVAAPVQLRLGGPDATPIHLEPGRPIVLGTTPESPLAAQLRQAEGIGNKHATLGLDHDGRLWIRDHPGSNGVWVNGDRIDAGQRVTINEGDRIGLGPEFVSTARLGGPDTDHPPAAFHFPAELRIPPIRLHPGQEVPFSMRYYDSDRNVPSGHAQVFRTGMRDVYLGRDADGRVWVRDPQPDLPPPVEVNGRALDPGEKRYLQPSDTVKIGGHPARMQIGDEPPLSVRLSDDEQAPPLTLRRGEEIPIGRDPGSPMARQLAGNDSVSPRHATLFRDEYGALKLRDEHSERGTWVNGTRIDPDAPAVTLRPGDTVRFGDWPGSARFTDSGNPVLPKTLPVKLNSTHGDLSFDLPRGGDPLILGRNNSELPTDLPRRELLSRQHASLGAHPSGRVWIRDDGSSNGTRVNGEIIPHGVKVSLNPGDQVNLGNAYEFTASFLPAEGGPFVDITDATPQTRKMVEELSRIPFRIYQRVSEHMNAIPGGGIVIGNRQMLDLPGTSSLQGSTPYGRKPGTSWNTVRGVYLPGPRRIVINSGGRGGSENVVWHEFGHATDAAYGTGGRWLSDAPQWREIHDAMKRDLGPKRDWNSYYDHPREAFAEAFTAWTFGGTSMLKKFTLGDQVMADRLKAYFDRVFR
ncbi:FHA domain-containing protein [Nocardia carnea]|uniref:FHA domain-containing protein n=1 Tax=Nocardia carnea TaxID=37328 RepID=A0ABW7TNN9_9NOCA|nr:FHA domain-containing protein [Nocardia carnea]